MKGTEKQIKWAEDIINDAYNTIDANIARMEKESKEFFHFNIQAYKECRKKLEETLETCDDAAVIIKCRNQFDPRRINEMVGRMAEKARQERQMSKGEKKNDML